MLQAEVGVGSVGEFSVESRPAGATGPAVTGPGEGIRHVAAGGSSNTRGYHGYHVFI